MPLSERQLAMQAQNSNGHLVVMKSLLMQEVATWQQLEQLENEVEILNMLNHPSIPACLEYGEHMQGFCMVQVSTTHFGTSFSCLTCICSLWTSADWLAYVYSGSAKSVIMGSPHETQMWNLAV